MSTDYQEYDIAGAAIPPHSIMAEQGVIGGLMIDKDAWHKVQAVVTAGDFYRKDHQLLFKAIAKLFAAGEPVDVITVHELLKSRGHDETVGGLGYIVSMARDTPSSSNIGHYAGIVRDKSLLRKLITVAGSIRELAFATDADSKAVLAGAETAIFELAQQNLRGKKGFSKLNDVLKSVLTTLEENFDKPSTGVLGVTTGFEELDNLTSGLNSGNLVVIAGRPAMGKTTIAMNIAESAAQSGKTVAVFSMEMEADEIGQRFLSSASNVGLKEIRESWKIEEHQWPLLTAGLSRISDLPLYIDDSANLSVAEIRSRCMRLNAEIKDDAPGGIGMIVIDYLQLMGSDTNRSGNRNNEIEDITRGLKRLAKEFGVPVIILSQLNRELERRPNKRPQISDLRDSGGIEQDADIVMFVYRDEIYNPETQDKGIAEVIIGKQRSGPLGTVRLLFEGGFVRFRSFVGGYDADRY